MNPAIKEARLKDLWQITTTLKSIYTKIGADSDSELLDEPIKRLATIEDEKLFLEFYAKNLQLVVGLMQSAEIVANVIQKQNGQLAESVDTYNERKILEGENSDLNSIF